MSRRASRSRRRASCRPGCRRPGAVTSGFRKFASLSVRSARGKVRHDVAVLADRHEDAFRELDLHCVRPRERGRGAAGRRRRRSSRRECPTLPASPFMTIGAPATLLYTTTATAPASSAFAIFTWNSQPPRSISATWPASIASRSSAADTRRAGARAAVAELAARRRRRSASPRSAIFTRERGREARLAHRDRRRQARGRRDLDRRRRSRAGLARRRDGQDPGALLGEPIVPRFGPSLPAATTVEHAGVERVQQREIVGP